MFRSKGIAEKKKKKGGDKQGQKQTLCLRVKEENDRTHTHTIRDPADEKQCHPQMHGRECKLVIVILLMILGGCDFGRLLLLMVVSCW